MHQLQRDVLLARAGARVADVGVALPVAGGGVRVRASRGRVRHARRRHYTCKCVIKLKTKVDPRKLLQTSCGILDIYVPASLPSVRAHSAMECTWLCGSCAAVQCSRGTFALTPIVPMLALAPPRYAVAEHAESAICASTQYVCDTPLLCSTTKPHAYRKLGRTTDIDRF